MSIQKTTQYIQGLIDACPVGGTVEIPAGEYEIGSIFLKSAMTLVLNEDVCLKGSQNLADYPQIATRIAGIRMTWPAALVNALDCHDVTICGSGKIDGQGKIWWLKFWGADQKSAMLADYEAKGLRWNVDYDCQRPRNILLQNCQKVTLADFTSQDSGFWNTQVLDSRHVTLEKLTIKNGQGPSTDGIDIDSSEDVVVEGCYVECNDDNICIKSGRGLEAQAEGRTTKNVTIKNCHLGAGSGITLGSEVSGGIEDITICDNYFDHTGVGFRIKSSRNRGGYIKDIHVKNLTMKNVQYPFRLMLNWFPAYSYSGPVEDIAAMPEHWQKIIADVKGPAGLTKVSNLHIEKVTADFDDIPLSCGFYLEGNLEEPMTGITFKDLDLTVSEFGKITGVTDLSFNNVNIKIKAETAEKEHSYER